MARQYKTGLIITGDASGGIKAIQATEKELRQLNQGFDRGRRRARDFADEADETGQRLEFLRNTAIGVGSALAGAFAVSSMAGQARMISETNALAKALQTSTTELQAWQYAGEQVGIQGDKMGDIFKDASEKIGDFARTGGGEAADLIEQMGLNIKELLDLSPDQQLLKIGESLQALTPSERATFLESLADDAVRLQPLLENNAAVLRQYTDEARQLGVAMDQVDIDAAVEADRAVKQLTATGQGLANMLLAELGPGLNVAASGAASLVAELRDDEIGAAETALRSTAGAAAGLATAYLTIRGGLLAATAAQWAFNTAVRANPLMLAVGAASALVGALITTRDHMSEVERQAENTSREVRGLAEGFALLTEQQQINTRGKVLADLTEWRLEAAELGAEITKLNGLARESGQLTAQGGAMEIITPEQMARGRQARQELAALMTQIGAGTDTLKEMDSILEELGGSGGGLPNLAESSASATSELDRQAEAAQSLLDQLYPLQAAQREYAEKKAQIAQIALQENKSNEWLAESMRRLDDSYRNAGTAAEEYGLEAQRAAEGTETAFDASLTVMERGVERLDDAFVDQWRGLLDGSRSAMDSLEDILLDSMAQIAHNLTTRQLIIPIQAMITGEGQGQAGGGLFGGGGQGGGFDINPNTLVSAGKNIYGWVTGSGASAGGGWASQVAASGYSGWAGSATGTGYGAAGGAGGGWMSGAGAGLANAGALAAAYYAGGYVGSEVGGMVSDKKANSNYGQMAGTAIGSIWGPIGAGVGSAIGSVVDTVFGSPNNDLDIALQRRASQEGQRWDNDIVAEGAFGAVGFDAGNSHEVKDLWDVEEAQTLVESIAKMDDLFASIADSERERAAMQEAVLNTGHEDGRGYYGETSTPGDVAKILTSRYREAFAATGSQFQDLFERLFDDGLDAGAQEVARFGVALDTVEDALAGNQQALADARAEIASYSSDLEAYVVAAESMSAAASAMGVLEQASQRMGITFDATAGGAIHAASELQVAAGGVESLAGLQQQFYSQYASQTEQAAQSFSGVYESLRDITGQVPETTAQFRRLVEAQNLNTEAGREAYLQLLQLAPAFAQVAGSVEDVIGSIYQDVLGREADAGGLEYYVSLIESGGLTVAEALAQIRNSSEAASVAASDAADSIQDQADATRIAEQRARMEIELLRLQGFEAEATRRERQLELDAMNDSLDPLQERIWALRDAKEAEQERNQALEQARKTLAGFSTSIDDWLAQLTSTDQGMGTPQEQLDAAASAWQTQLAAARAGDQDALGSITQYADRYLDAAKGMYASGEGSQAVLDRITSALETLPEQLSPEQLLADELKGAISGAAGDVIASITGLTTSVAQNFEGLDANVDGLLTFSELKRGLAGKATNSQIRSMIARMDVNADDQVSQLESLIAQSSVDAGLIGSTLETEMRRLGGEVLTAEQARRVLAPHATDAEISRLIERIDANGDGLLSAQELTAARVSGLAQGIGSTLEPMFDGIDLNTDGLINYDEFGKQFAGLASDAELRRIYRRLDIDGDGTISRLEAVQANTAPLNDARLDGLKVSLGLHHEPLAWQDAAYNMATVWGDMGIAGFGAAKGGYLERGPEDANSGGSSSGGGSSTGGTTGGGSSGGASSNAPAKARSWIDLFWDRIDDVAGSASLGYLEREYQTLSGAENAVGVALDRIQGLGGNIPSGRVSDLAADWSFFADGGVFANSIVDRPTAFQMGMMGEAGPEAIMPLASGPDGLGVRMYDAPPMPELPLLGQGDVLEVLNDMRRELKTSNAENQRLRAEVTNLLDQGNRERAEGNRRGESQRATQIREQQTANRINKQQRKGVMT
ncbi:DUF4214 domain-containing protein [Halomonas organivorans]|uniref:EF-hand domain-containing protein n=1 Tax=Halomonas organivorans TaxID=257772 RepID=A0A7W5G738_9GAMM|nr:DUF4214 domain-containing protein [Halomonas organivorans]MBB3142835.1 hypothetical protein [Halomonas organivorans]